VRRRIDLRRDDGVAMTEFALIIPVFLLIVAGLLGFGRFFFYWIEANHLANETARWAVVDRNPYKSCGGSATGAPGCRTLQQQAVNSVNKEFQSQTSVCISFPTTQTVGQPVKVDIRRPFTLLPILNVGTIDITGSATMRMERFEGGIAPQNFSSGGVGTCP
jgi:hypothetical protein